MNYYDGCIDCKDDGTQILCKNYCSGEEVPFTYVSCNCDQPNCTLDDMKNKVKYPEKEYYSRSGKLECQITKCHPAMCSLKESRNL